MRTLCRIGDKIEQRPDHHHNNTGVDTFTGNICSNTEKTVFLILNNIIVVAANTPSLIKKHRKIQVRRVDELFGKQNFLNTACNIGFIFDSS